MGYGRYSERGSHNRIGSATHEETIRGWIAGRTVYGSRMMADGPSIYSYGRHFEIARFAWIEGERVALFTREGFSTTTSGHKSKVRNALGKAGVRVLESFTMDGGMIGRHDDALKFTRAAITHLQDKRLSTDLYESDKARGLLDTGAEHEQLYGGPIPELAPLRAQFETLHAAFLERATRIHADKTRRVFRELFAMEGVTGEFISAGAYLVPGADGEPQRRLCAYWSVSDGRFARVVKGYGGLTTTFLAALPADMHKGV